MRIAIFFLVFIASLSTGVAGFCQGVPGCYPQPLPAMKPCAPNRPAPISRTVQVEVPVPCAPTACGGPMLCPPQPCGQPACAPPSPTRPVQVRVDVVVRPEPCARRPPVPEGCLDLGPMAPLVGLVAGIMAVPIRILETVFPGSGPCTPSGLKLGPPPKGCFTGYPLPARAQLAPGAAMFVRDPASWGPTTSATPPCGPSQRHIGSAQRASLHPVCRPFPRAQREGIHGRYGSQPLFRGGDQR